MAKKIEALTELEKKYEHSEELEENGFVFDEASGMYVVIPKQLTLF